MQCLSIISFVMLLLNLCLTALSGDNLGKHFGPRYGPTNRQIVTPDQGPNCLTC